ncbi:NADPH-dependent FMN reductase [Sorangium sp. So ce429]
MSSIAIITGSVSARSKTGALAARIGARLGREGFRVTTVNVRDLPAEDVLFGRVDSPAVAEVTRIIAEAAGVVIATPIYKASYTGALKALLDLLPQFGLAGKAVLPLATGGTLAHVLAIDYGLRPVLQSLGARHVLAGLFLLDKALRLGEDGQLEIDDELGNKLEEIVRPFIDSVLREGFALPAREVAAA